MGKRRRRLRRTAEVDWSREPRDEAEAALRAAFLARRLEVGSLGWIDLLCLAADRPTVASDLRRAADEAERRLRRRVEAAQAPRAMADQGPAFTDEDAGPD